MMTRLRAKRLRSTSPHGGEFSQQTLDEDERSVGSSTRRMTTKDEVHVGTAAPVHADDTTVDMMKSQDEPNVTHNSDPHDVGEEQHTQENSDGSDNDDAKQRREKKLARSSNLHRTVEMLQRSALWMGETKPLEIGTIDTTTDGPTPRITRRMAAEMLAAREKDVADMNSKAKRSTRRTGANKGERSNSQPLQQQEEKKRDSKRHLVRVPSKDEAHTDKDTGGSALQEGNHGNDAPIGNSSDDVKKCPEDELGDKQATGALVGEAVAAAVSVQPKATAKKAAKSQPSDAADDTGIKEAVRGGGFLRRRAFARVMNVTLYPDHPLFDKLKRVSLVSLKAPVATEEDILASSTFCRPDDLEVFTNMLLHFVPETLIAQAIESSQS